VQLALVRRRRIIAISRIEAGVMALGLTGRRRMWWLPLWWNDWLVEKRIQMQGVDGC